MPDSNCTQCHKKYTINPKIDAYDREYCKECLDKEYKSLWSLYYQKGTKNWDKPAGKRMRPKTKKGSRAANKKKRIYYRDFVE